MSEPAKPYIGGQAVIEGVMMRAPAALSTAVRRPDGTIVIQERPLEGSGAAAAARKLPLVRGVWALFESMSLGYQSLRFSAEQQMTEAERTAAAGASGRGAMVLSTAIALGLFVALPQLLTAGASWLGGLGLDVQDPAFHALTGGFKLAVLLGYLVAISQMDEVRRVFQYHGAEHKTISAYEAGLPLTVENVRAQTTLHPRCGTTFLVVVVLVSILVGTLVTPLVLPAASGVLGQAQTLALRISLLPVIAAFSFELQRLSARYCTTGWMRVFLYPGFLFQKITTREPDDSQIEIAIVAMQTALRRVQADALATPTTETVRTYASFPTFEAAFAPVAPPIAAE